LGLVELLHPGEHMFDSSGFRSRTGEDLATGSREGSGWADRV
jgi:hypothetical protein